MTPQFRSLQFRSLQFRSLQVRSPQVRSPQVRSFAVSADNTDQIDRLHHLEATHLPIPTLHRARLVGGEPDE